MDDLKYCKDCEEANPPDAKFCAWCGAKFVSAAAPPPDTAPSGSPSTRQPPSSPPESQRMKYQKGALLFVALSLVALVLLGVALSLQPAPAYEWKTGVNPPREVSDLIKRGPVVLYFEWPECPYCNDVTPKIATLQSQYPNVTFVTLNPNNNSTASVVANTYGVTQAPTLIVVRGDGAAAYFIGNSNINVDPSSAKIDYNSVQSAIADAQNWQQSNPTPSPTSAGYNAILGLHRTVIMNRSAFYRRLNVTS